MLSAKRKANMSPTSRATAFPGAKLAPGEFAQALRGNVTEHYCFGLD